ncbi:MULTISPECIES: DMT family transporter [Desulfitobacterium]|uniref:Putative permease, DMT superfamily n=1 Tax=Desulfitobacterium dehalogenans (strain ATCC 51507 / DSM 9161 / JW/IU-DC1) TaxID=756499 RepID=I4A7I6_DESDJ|nr:MULTISPECIES: DMT family transporter [Desulfitobacterium]AFL99920.1 putative permease, DMT superfamily [Desulfitobacterium dehalogenans ATCC 51507]
MLQSKKESNRGIWLIALGAALWGLDGVLIVALLQHVTSSQIVWLEHLLLSLFAVPVLLLKRHELKRLNPGDWLALLFIAWGGSALASILFTAGFTYGNPNVVLLLQKVQPIFAILLASWLLKERMRKDFYALFVAALIGAYLLTFGLHMPTSGVSSSELIGSLCAIGAAALWGGSTVMGKRLVGKLSFTTLTALRFAIALPLLTIIVFAQHPNWANIGQALSLAPVWANLLFQTLVPSLISLLLYYRGLNGVRASYATIAELAFPATGLLLNWFILHQTIDLGQWIGFAIVWLAVLQLSRMPNDPKSTVKTSDGANFASL